jgi:hypothetical protein
VKNSVTLSGIKTATNWFVVQCLNQLRHCMPQKVQWLNGFHISAIKDCCYEVDMDVTLAGHVQPFYFSEVA